MSTIQGVSFLAQSQAQTSRINETKRLMDDLQRQITTQKKYDTLAGFGVEAKRVLSLRAEKIQTETYLDNIDALRRRMKMMNDNMEQALSMCRNFMAGLQNYQAGSEQDIDIMNTVAEQGLFLMRDVANQQLDGRYIFAGSTTDTAPVYDLGTLHLSAQFQVTNWLNGTNTTTQMNTNVDALTSAQMGFDLELTNAGAVTMTIDRDFDVDYTVIADQSGMDQIMRGLALGANLTFPSSTDTPTEDDVRAALDHIKEMVRDGMDQLQHSMNLLNSKIELISNMEETHKTDRETILTQLDALENADTSEAIVSLQAIQTQLTASYQITKIVSQMSLTNFI